MPKLLPLLGLAGLFTAVPALAQNDDCATAIPLVNGMATPFDTTVASQSALPWNCAFGGGPDLWYTYVPTNSGVSMRVETCGSSYDTALEIYEGTCAAPILIECNDDYCGLQSRVDASSITAGQTYLIRVGGYNGSTGAGTITVLEGMPPVQGCVLNSGFESGDLAGWNFVDIAGAFNAGGANAAGHDVGFGLFVSAPTEALYSFTSGFDGQGPGVIVLGQQLSVTSGLTPLTFDYRAGWDMLNFPGSTLDRTFDVVVRDTATGVALQTTALLTATAGTSNLDTGIMMGSVDLSMFIGQTVDVNFEWTIPETATGPAHFELDNISCPAGTVIGTSYCGPAPMNSTGSSATMSAAGSPVASANALTLVASDLPANSFGFFVASQSQGFVMNPGGSMGNLCLGGAIGRYVGSGQIQNSGSAQEISLLLDLTMTPTPTGLVSIAAGDVWNFQAWFRDAVAGVATSNFTDGLEVTFL